MRVTMSVIPLALAFGVAGADAASIKFQPVATYTEGQGAKQVVVTYGVDDKGTAHFNGVVQGTRERGKLFALCQDVHQYAAMWKDDKFRKGVYMEAARSISDAEIAHNSADAIFGALNVSSQVCISKGFVPKLAR